jgi:hypothetical protein
MCEKQEEPVKTLTEGSLHMEQPNQSWFEISTCRERCAA